MLINNGYITMIKDDSETDEVILNIKDLIESKGRLIDGIITDKGLRVRFELNQTNDYKPSTFITDVMTLIANTNTAGDICYFDLENDTCDSLVIRKDIHLSGHLNYINGILRFFDTDESLLDNIVDYHTFHDTDVVNAETQTDIYSTLVRLNYPLNGAELRTLTEKFFLLKKSILNLV